MKRFVFRLEPVLRQREIAERERQRAVAELERERISLERTIDECRRGAEAERAEWLGGLGGPRPDLGAVRQQANASLALVVEAQRAAVRLAGVHRRLETARAALVRAAAARKAMERLRERQLAEHRAELARREAAAADEMMVTRHGRRAEVTP